MVRKPAKMYRAITKRAYTRREYMGGVPGSKVTQFNMGNTQGHYPIEITIEADESCQIQNKALEAARMAVNRKLLKDVGRMNYLFKLRTYPHHVLRENKQATGAGADRVSEGMRLSFGKAVGTAARISRRQKIFTVYTTEQYLAKSKDALKAAGYKLPTPTRITVKDTTVAAAQN